MSNIENLIPMNQRTESEQRKIARSGGIASGISRNNKKSIKELINTILDSPLDDMDTFFETPLPEKTHRAKVALGIVKAAERGDIKAFQTLLKLTNEKEDNSD